MTNFKKLFLAFFLIASFSNFTSQAMEKPKEDDDDDELLTIKKEWSEDDNYLYITINDVVWKFGPFNDSNENEENQPTQNTAGPSTPKSDT